jgi:tight adherence protein B
MGWLSGVLAGFVVWMALPGDGARRLRPPRRPPERLARLAKAWPVWLGAGVGWLVSLVWGVAVGLALALPVATAAQVVRRIVRQKLAHKRSERVLSGCRELSGLLRLGQLPLSALTTVAAGNELFSSALAAHRVGCDVAAEFRKHSKTPGYEGLAELALAWQLAENTGASLVATLDSLANRMKAEAETKATVRAELAAAQSTCRLLAILPLAGIALGYGMGGDPLAFLTGSAFGNFALVAGAGLACAGVLWSERISNG